MWCLVIAGYVVFGCQGLPIGMDKMRHFGVCHMDAMKASIPTNKTDDFLDACMRGHGYTPVNCFSFTAFRPACYKLSEPAS